MYTFKVDLFKSLWSSILLESRGQIKFGWYNKQIIPPSPKDFHILIPGPVTLYGRRELKLLVS